MCSFNTNAGWSAWREWSFSVHGCYRSERDLICYVIWISFSYTEIWCRPMLLWLCVWSLYEKKRLLYPHWSISRWWFLIKKVNQRHSLSFMNISLLCLLSGFIRIYVWEHLNVSSLFMKNQFYEIAAMFVSTRPLIFDSFIKWNSSNADCFTNLQKLAFTERICFWCFDFWC
jgi:hypothetical protein